MPIKKAALKRMRSDRKRRLRNASVVGELKTLARKFERLIQGKEKEKAIPLLREAFQKLDKAVSRGIIHKNRASRKKSRLSRKLAALLGKG